MTSSQATLKSDQRLHHQGHAQWTGRCSRCRKRTTTRFVAWAAGGVDAVASKKISALFAVGSLPEDGIWEHVKNEVGAVCPSCQIPVDVTSVSATNGRGGAVSLDRIGTSTDFKIFRTTHTAPAWTKLRWATVAVSALALLPPVAIALLGTSAALYVTWSRLAVISISLVVLVGLAFAAGVAAAGLVIESTLDPLARTMGTWWRRSSLVIAWAVLALPLVAVAQPATDLLLINALLFGITAGIPIAVARVACRESLLMARWNILVLTYVGIWFVCSACVLVAQGRHAGW